MLMRTLWLSFVLSAALGSILDAQNVIVRPSLSAKVFSNGVSVPSDYPDVNISVKNNPDSGYIFINNWGGTPYIAILNTNGEPVFYRKMPANARDFKVQSNGNLSYRLSSPYSSFFEMDSSYTVLREIKAKNGFGTDEHELLILPNGNVLLIALEWKTVDMSVIVSGGKTSATVIGNHIQEIDPSGNLVFEWKCWDHLDITDAVHENLTAQTIDYVHMNAIDVDTDGHLLISSRHLSEITKIHRQTGNIIWRFGGKKNQFTILNDPLNGPSYQHDIRALPNGHYTLMDNGNFHSPPLSRAAEYVLDTAAMTATLVWQYRHMPDRYTWWMGNVQRLPNGNTLINWADGSLPKLTEVTPEGTKAMELGFVNYAHSYRVFKFPWKGKGKAPDLTLEPGSDFVTMLYNRFDQSEGHRYVLYIDTLPQPTIRIDTVDYTAAEVTGLKSGKKYYFRVTALDALGNESPFSNEESMMVSFIKPGENMVVNGDFSSGFDEWDINVTSPGAGVPYITALGELLVQIGSGGTQTWHVQLAQEGLPVINGRKYRFAFDAYATANRSIEVKVAMIAAPNTNYSKTGLIALTTSKKSFSFDFTMQDATDANARIVFNCGISDVDVLIDNVSLKELVPATAGKIPERIPEGFSLRQNFPNPFNPSTTIEYSIPSAGWVSMRVYDLLGREVIPLVNAYHQAGSYHTTFSAEQYRLPSGVYVYTLSSGLFHAARRMIVIN